MLCEGILRRNIIVNCFDEGHVYEEQVFLQTAGQLNAYKYEIEKRFKMIRKLLSIEGFIKIWTYSDVKFCPVFGPFVGYLIR